MLAEANYRTRGPGTVKQFDPRVPAPLPARPPSTTYQPSMNYGLFEGLQINDEHAIKLYVVLGEGRPKFGSSTIIRLLDINAPFP
ncbi:hypothetical protein EVAR_27099_1 [Eumeta japonica]|uniref:Uncharacterized protein n=1 Tax=Eumeta variegata TaxID=151549 RepID=A0A4C1VKI4_EUMVA|nr:hypothetical protein EVAR_27099_1 [Eumeta japonica]